MRTVEDISLSATTLQAWRQCPMKFVYHKLCQLKKIETTDSLRIGTCWHKLLEICGTHERGEAMQLATEYINEQYEAVPENKTRFEWDTERTILLYSLAAYNWFYDAQVEQYEVVACELDFSLPLPGISVPIIGKIDQIVRDRRGVVLVREFKSTRRAMDDETYWGHLNLDLQVGLYVAAANHLRVSGMLEQCGIAKTDPFIDGILYNVWRKPSIRPTRLTQKASKELMKTGEYCGQKFKVSPEIVADGESATIVIDDEIATATPGAKDGTYAISETTRMYGARLLTEMTSRPEVYFRQEELVRRAAELETAVNDIISMWKVIEFQGHTDTWYKNDMSCQSPYRCEFMPICYSNVEIDVENPPDGFEIIS